VIEKNDPSRRTFVKRSAATGISLSFAGLQPEPLPDYDFGAGKQGCYVASASEKIN
jgi:hypothetical protein